MGVPGGASGKEPACQFSSRQRPGFDPWAGKILRRKWQTTPVFLPGESPRTEEPGRLQSLWSQIVGHDRAHSLSIILGPGHIAETKADKNKTKQTKTPCTVYI